MSLLNSLRKIKRSISPSFQPLLEVIIHGENLLHNLCAYQTKYPQTKFAPVLKSNAYGHGMVLVAHLLEKAGIPFFMVDSLYEAALLRAEGIKTPLLILGFNTADNILSSKLANISFGIVGLEQLEEVSKKINSPQKFHLKIDTGMHRQGITEYETEKAFSIISNNSHIQLEGISTHFSDADGTDKSFTLTQISRWNKICYNAKNKFPSLKYFHAANTAGNAYHKEAFTNVARLGLGLYGINISPFEPLEIKPALEMKSRISSVRIIQPGESVGYNNTFTAKQTMRIATIPAGYYEGMDRRLSNCGFVKIDGKSCPIIGRVSMNMLSADVTAANNAHVGTEVTLISHIPDEKNSVENIAKTCDSIAHEILVHIPGHLRRRVVN